jgi:4-hydroxythreonine-4-phosphate dehydrogenase
VRHGRLRFVRQPVALDMSKPRVAITVGDPSGIGPEVAAAAAADPAVRDICEPVLYGPPSGQTFQAGRLSADAGRAAYEAIVRATADAMRGSVDAVATAPINKKALRLAGLPWSGHTDLLAYLTGATHVAMMFYSDPLSVVLATVHVSLAEVPALLTRDLMEATIALTAKELPRFGRPSPRIAVAGLNPHAGEHGLFGREEETAIGPAIAAARGRGIDVAGPFPADTIFVRAVRGEFDVVVACYHDQGLIPVKLAAFGRAVNVTLGLPIVRTSVDHGTAFDIAGKGIADAGSMVEAVRLAARLASTRNAETAEGAENQVGRN